METSWRYAVKPILWPVTVSSRYRGSVTSYTRMACCLPPNRTIRDHNRCPCPILW